ncbi:MAG: nucleotidyltransferase substrate binding protein [Planctomycetaceae bacterium]|jgi:nucleotidyltransferase substrate binding protein (TIGR01987 family)|nr:nucleotidyltransferase substrate binding protein [Planctomycetaceae bacterium]
MTIDLTSLAKSVKVLRESVEDYLRNGSTFTPVQQETFRSGIIQNFEIAYELCWKTMKRWIEENVSPDILFGVPRIELFRRAAENGLIDSVEHWITFHQARNRTSHIYGAEVAKEVYDTAVRFVADAEAFLQNITVRNTP